MIDRYNTTLTSKVYQTINNSNLYNSKPLTLAIMTTIDIYNIEQRLGNPKFRITKSNNNTGKTKSGKKERATKKYFKNFAARACRKKGKPTYNTTHRREEQPDPEDERLEEIHFANFMGEKTDKTSFDIQRDEVNVNMCDMLKPAEHQNHDDYDEDNSASGLNNMLNQMDAWREKQGHLEQEEYEFARQQDEWGCMVNDCDFDYDREPPNVSSDNEFEYDEEQDREDNYTMRFYDIFQKRYRIWKPISGHPKGGRIVCESDDENSQGSCH